MTRKLETKGWCYVSGEVRHQTERAVLFYDGAQEVWLAKSQIEDPGEFVIGETVELLLPEWLAGDKGLI
jgi:hypothetical protein